MSNIPTAKPSPRLENGAIKWYQGDTFEVQLTLSLTDQDGESVALTSEDSAEVVFRDSAGRGIKTFTIDNLSTGVIRMEFAADTTALFAAGRYMYDVHISHEHRTTICNDNIAVVE